MDVFWRYIRRPLLLVAVERKCRGPQVDEGQLRHGRVLNMVHFACKGPCFAVDDVASVYVGHPPMLQCHLNESSVSCQASSCTPNVKKSSLSLSQDVELIIAHINVSYVESIFGSFALHLWTIWGTKIWKIWNVSNHCIETIWNKGKNLSICWSSLLRHLPGAVDSRYSSLSSVQVRFRPDYAPWKKAFENFDIWLNWLPLSLII